MPKTRPTRYSPSVMSGPDGQPGIAGSRVRIPLTKDQGNAYPRSCAGRNARRNWAHLIRRPTMSQARRFGPGPGPGCKVSDFFIGRWIEKGSTDA